MNKLGAAQNESGSAEAATSPSHVQVSSVARISELNQEAIITLPLNVPAMPEAQVIQTAALWFADQHEAPKAAVPELRKRFGISAVEACEAIALARKFQINRRAFD